MLQTIAISGYLLGAFALVLFMYQIARFYRSRLDPQTPVVGFLLSMVFLVISVTGMLSGNNQNEERYFVDVALFFAGSLAIWNSIALYLRMKRVYK